MRVIKKEKNIFMTSSQDKTDSIINKIIDTTSKKTGTELFKQLRSLLLNYHNDYTNQFETIFDQSTLGNKIIDDQLKIIKVNPALTKLLGYQEQELIGMLITDIADPEYIDDWKRLQKELWASKRPSFTIETSLIKKDGTMLWCSVTSIIYEDEGQSFGYTIVEDISERKHMERLKAELDSKKDEFIGIVSHELRTPLTTIKAINQILAKSVKQDQSYYSFITKSNHHILRLERLITDLLDLTHIQGGSVQLNYSTFNFDQFVSECVSSLNTIHLSHQLVLENSFKGEVEADQFRIEQVMINFVNNAVKYSPSADQVEIRTYQEAEQVKIEIRDFGIGIEQKHIEQIFNRFYRVDEISHHFQGLGLGLYISSEIIQKHQGAFGISTEPGKGSTFWFSLPLRRPEPAE
jgi:PAS domain S-box-containing protein